jgi:hypothetical protein
MRQIHQTLLSEKELHHAIMDYLHTHGIPDAYIDEILILCDGGSHQERVMPNCSADFVRVCYTQKKK